MSEYLIQSETLESLGDEVRVLGETEDRKSPVGMTSVVNAANGVISSQGTLIQEIIEELEGKIAGGGAVEDVPITITENGVTEAPEGVRYTPITVNVPPTSPWNKRIEDYSTMPEKGQIITMNLDGTDRQYRVLKTEGKIAEVLAMFSPGNVPFNENY